MKTQYKGQQQLEHLVDKRLLDRVEYEKHLTLEEWTAITKGAKPLKSNEAQLIVNMAILMLQELYVHMDLKRTRRGVNPVQQLNVFKERLQPRNGISSRVDPRMFHRSMLEIFKSLGDVHTAYRLPDPYKRAIAFLPFLVSAFVEKKKPQYVVSHVLPEKDPKRPRASFARGVEITSWNGVPMVEAVRRSAEFEEGSNTAHDLALALQFMTVRWLGASFEPESPWVEVGYKDDKGNYREETFWWKILLFKNDPRFVEVSQAAASVFNSFRPGRERQRAVHVGSDYVHAGRMALFVPEKRKTMNDREALAELGAKLRTRFFGYIGRRELREFTEGSDLLRPTAEGEFPSLLPDYLEAREHDGKSLIREAEKARVGGLNGQRDSLEGKTFGYIGIRAFPLTDPDRGIFKYEFRRLLNLVPGDGLILDVRDNPGGSTNNAETILQFLTARDITPLPFRFIASPLTRKLAKHSSGAYSEYQPSISTALSTGSRFSAGRPITSVQSANALGQHYFGPVLLITSATTYSAADIFAAGFEDNGIGPVLGLDETTGAGGANCWFYEEYIARVLNNFKRLPHGVNMQTAVRQCVRVGKDNAGVPIEEIGVESNDERRYALKKQDVLQPRPWGLLVRAATELAQKPTYDLVTSLTSNGTRREVSVSTRNINRLDFYVNGRPTSIEVTNQPVPPLSLPINERVHLEIQGFADGKDGPERVARYIQIFPD